MFRKKTALNDEKRNALIRILSDILKVQMVAATGHNIEDANGRINRRAIGYIGGFVDAALTMAGQNTSDASVGVPILYQVLRNLFPGYEDRYTEFLIKNQRDAIITLGMMKGGQQYVDKASAVQQGNNKGHPMGLARYLLEGDAE